MSGDVIDFEARKLADMPHLQAEVVCLKCLHRVRAVWPAVTPLKQLECSGCGEIGFIITTGQRDDE